MSCNILHVHCDSCFRRKCTAITDPPCPIVSCATFCGAAFHECKASEHRELCPLEKVPCINVGNGCPVMLRRCDVRRHLPSCPASVVCCTMEWCRWPMYSRERGTRVPFAPSSLRARCGQLDVALALRDQRTLDRAKKFPRRSLVRALRNSFTKRYPAVPLVVGGNPTFIGEGDGNSAGEFSFSESDDEEKEASSRAPWLTTKEPPGLKRSIVSELFCELPTKSAANGSRVSDLAAEDVRCALCTKHDAEHPTDMTVCPKAAPVSVTQALVYYDSDNEESSSFCHDACQPESESSVSHLLSNGCKSSSESGPSSNQAAFKVLKPVDETCTPDMSDKNPAQSNECEFVGVRSNSSVIADSAAAGRDVEVVDVVQKQIRVGPVTSRNGDSTVAGYQLDDGQVGEGKTKITGNEADSITTESVTGRCGDGLPGSESSPPTLHEVLAVDLNVEVCSRYHIRDPSLYSFVCAQLFRRDEYSRHVRDVHSVVHDAIDLWLEVRCPLAHCGCTFSAHRRLPSGASVTFSPLLESLGLRRTDTPVSAVEESASNEPQSSDLVSAEILTAKDSHPVECVEAESVGVTHNDNITSAVAGSLPKEAANLPVSSPDQCSPEVFHSRDVDSAVCVRPENSEKAGRTGRNNADGLNVSGDDKISAVECRSAKEPVRSVRNESTVKECTPEMFTSREFDSVVCILPRTSKEQTAAEDGETLRLTGLPFEVLTHIATFLDSFSLCNLSLTCWILRDVCRGLLKPRGLVVQEWQRDCSRNPPHWKVSHQRWLFSTAFDDAISQWQFTDQSSMAEHLKVCPFNVVHHWDADRIPLCQMADVVSTEKETSRLYRFVWKKSPPPPSAAEPTD